MSTPPLKLRRVVHRADRVDVACISCTRPESDVLTFAATRFWKVVLHPDQTVPGALLLTSLRHVAKVSDLTADESGEWFALFRAVEVALETGLGAAMVNVSCERNWAFRAVDPNPPLIDGRPNPHVHWHVAPRYSEPVEIGGERFVDEDFGEPLAWAGRSIEPSTAALLIETLLDTIARQPGVDLLD